MSAERDENCFESFILNVMYQYVINCYLVLVENNKNVGTE